MSSVTSHEVGHCIVCGKTILSDEDYIKNGRRFCCKSCILRQDSGVMI